MKKKLGFSIVSLMIGITISTVVLMALIQVFGTTRNSLKINRNVAAMNDALRYVTYSMTKVISQTGYVSTTGDIPVQNQYMGNGPPANSGFGWNNDSDAAFFIYQGHANGQVLNCDGKAASAGVENQSMYYLAPVGATNRDGHTLWCQPVNGVTVGTPVEIVSNIVDAFLIRYGEDNNGDGSVDRYVETITPSQSKNVRSVRVAILLRSPDEVRTTAVAEQFQLFDTIVSTNDKYIRKLNVFTILTPNVMLSN